MVQRYSGIISILFIYLFIYLFIWLRRVFMQHTGSLLLRAGSSLQHTGSLVVACGI